MLRAFPTSRICLTIVALLFCAATANSQNALTIARVYIANADGVEVTNDSGNVHVVDSSGKDTIPSKLRDQVSCSSAKISADKTTAGWLVNYENCCTSYPIPTTLALYRAGKVIQTISPGRSIYDWRFWKSDQVALSSGPVHGGAVQMGLYDVRTGKLLKEWAVEEKRTPPDWAKGLRD